MILHIDIVYDVVYDVVYDILILFTKLMYLVADSTYQQCY